MARVLIVDDKGTNPYPLETLLTEHGFEVIAARTGKDALDEARKNPPDLIISDMLMPGIDGFSLCREWKSDDTLKHIPFIFYTSTYTESKDERFALSLGADRYVIKPQEPDALLTIIKEVLKESRNTKQTTEKPLGEEMEFFRQHNEILFKKLEQKMLELEAANRELKEWQERYRQRIDNTTDIICTVGNDLVITEMSPSVEKLLGVKPHYLIGRPITAWGKFLTPESFERIMDNIHQILQKGVSIPSATYEFIGQGESTVYIEMSGAPITRHEEIVGLISVARDVTARKMAENSLLESEQKYRSLFEKSIDAIMLTAPDGSILDANPAACEMFGMSVDDIRRAGRNGLVDRSDPRLKKILEERDRTGKITNAEFTMIRANGEKFPVEGTSIIFTDAHGRQKTSMIIRDITERKKAEEDLKQSFEQVRKGLRATVRAIAEMVEARDPYTAGHQRRVSDLARSIATEMKLPKDRIEGLRTAATIHDLGKISIPAELLSKPAILTKMEFALIKNHPQAAYDILKNIEFPWPVARMVLEHHERMDGSGYPNGLKEDEILLESRILAVADVVEAMASHRPYRSALGIDVALEEINKNKGILYDPKAVDACSRLFKEKGYTLREFNE